MLDLTGIPRECSVVHVKKGAKVEDTEGVKRDETSVILKVLKRGQSAQVSWSTGVHEVRR